MSPWYSRCRSFCSALVPSNGWWNLSVISRVRSRQVSGISPFSALCCQSWSHSWASPVSNPCSHTILKLSSGTMCAGCTLRYRLTCDHHTVKSPFPENWGGAMIFSVLVGTGAGAGADTGVTVTTGGGIPNIGAWGLTSCCGGAGGGLGICGGLGRCC